MCKENTLLIVIIIIIRICRIHSFIYLFFVFSLPFYSSFNELWHLVEIFSVFSFIQHPIHLGPQWNKRQKIEFSILSYNYHHIDSARFFFRWTLCVCFSSFMVCFCCMPLAHSKFFYLFIHHRLKLINCRMIVVDQWIFSFFSPI